VQVKLDVLKPPFSTMVIHHSKFEVSVFLPFLEGDFSSRLFVISTPITLRDMGT
jgi:hypothetical protein